MTKILILNVGGPNKGNLALVYSTIETIKRFVPDVEFDLMGPDKVAHDELRIKKQVGWGPSIRKPRYRIISLLYLVKSVCIYIFKRLGVHISISKKSRLFDYYDCDIVINSGGDQMSGEYGISTLGTFINISYAILLDKPVVLYGESLGYFRNPVLTSIAKFVLNRTKLILVREELSKKYLDDRRITNPKIYVTADPAFLLNPVPQSHVFEILSEEGIGEIQKPFIGINPSGLISRFMGGDRQKAEEKTTNTMAKVIDNLVENLGATIIMIPHVYTRNGDDRIAINSVFHKVKDKSKVKTIKNEYTPQELKGIIGQCDLFIGARMHATIASTSKLVPTVGIAYSHKMHGIIGEMLGQEKYVLDIKELDYDNLISTINDAWENREKIRKELEVKIPEMKEKAMLNGKLVKELLDSSNREGG
jgi:polysaccharide pyruvyl transferase WcaK-like protein